MKVTRRPGELALCRTNLHDIGSAAHGADGLGRPEALVLVMDCGPAKERAELEEHDREMTNNRVMNAYKSSAAVSKRLE